MDESIFLLDEQDNVGDVLGKINYNFLKHNNNLFDLESTSKNNFSTIVKLDRLMDRMDYLMSLVNFDQLQDLYTTVNLLSSYWNNYEFTVQYPFNPDNGFTSSLVVAGTTGELLGSTLLSEQENILINVLLTKNLPYIKTAEDAKTNLYNNGFIIVNRTDSGDFVSWDFINSSNIFNILSDKLNNLYYNGRLIDVYNIPYYSVITGASVDIAQNLTPDYDSKIILGEGNVPLLPEKTSIYANILIEYETFVFNNYDIGDGNFVPITQFIPKVEKFSSIIPDTNAAFASKIQGLNAELPASYTDNARIHNLAVNFLNDNYPPAMYPGSAVANVVFLLYNSVGPNSGETIVETLFWDDNTLTESKRNVEKLSKSTISKVAPTSNTTYNISYNKQNIYVEKIVTVKYEKVVEIKDTVTVVGGIHKTSQIPFSSWRYKGINVGRSYTPGLAGTYQKATIAGTPSLVYTG